MTDQTTPTAVLPDHVAVTDTVVARLAQCSQIKFHHTDGATGSIPRYIADEIGQAVLALVPDAAPVELTPVQYALLDALREVALSSEAPSGKYAGEQLARLVAAEFGHPLPEPVERDGGLTNFLYGRPIVTNPKTPLGTSPIDHAARQAQATGGPIKGAEADRG
ncbi:hypothetical protein APR04_003786 [Promicromonospora umidemergens]|uniref:Uncharacterized protein n=1 Tax=Promicromonospora umidemergens TaxID=629679 RepID=A0ABP8XJG2_9MICO|nr:hypothetical protein [Promicromonospora umidemergens]MCP2284863.1 hypothetical protein [Promicromonospora umidemergens]